MRPNLINCQLSTVAFVGSFYILLKKNDCHSRTQNIYDRIQFGNWNEKIGSGFDNTQTCCKFSKYLCLTFLIFINTVDMIKDRPHVFRSCVFQTAPYHNFC
jgi:hypothetical protein